mmetsp:Transcript_21380/g.54439  ORF Transcript_21380/g.54439 Transcript_21380/m.54439 type:complete len:228 (-) Transcript_21380:184-867(-)
MLACSRGSCVPRPACGSTARIVCRVPALRLNLRQIAHIPARGGPGGAQTSSTAAHGGGGSGGNGPRSAVSGSGDEGGEGGEIPSLKRSGRAFLAWGRKHGTFVLACFGTLVSIVGAVFYMSAYVQKLAGDVEKERELRAIEVEKERELRTKDVEKERELRAMDVQRAMSDVRAATFEKLLDAAHHADYKELRKDMVAARRKAEADPQAEAAEPTTTPGTKRTSGTKR